MIRALWEYAHANKIEQTEFKPVQLLATYVHMGGHSKLKAARVGELS